MSSADRFERLIRWYPPTWRARYGAEFVALLEDTHGMSDVPWRERLAIAKSGSVERGGSSRTAWWFGQPERTDPGWVPAHFVRVGFLHAGGWDLRQKFTESTGPP